MNVCTAGEIEDRPLPFDREGRNQRRTIIEQLPSLVAAVVHPLEHRLDLPRRLLAQGIHVLHHMLETHLFRKVRQGLTAPEYRSQHRPKIGEVVGQGPRRIRTVLQETLDTFPSRLTRFQNQGRRNDHALLGQRLRVRRHRARPDATDLRMMGSAGDVAQQAILEVDRRHQGHIGQMGAAKGRVVGDHHIARLENAVRDQLADTEAHRPEMDRNVGRVDDQPSGRIEQSTREILALLDVGRDRCPLQHLTHLPRN